MKGPLLALFLALLTAAVHPWRRCEATWYAKGLPQPEALTCASTTYGRGSLLLVIHGSNWAVLKVNDFGPEPGHPLVVERGRCLDVSLGAARRLGLVSKGYGEVLIIPLAVIPVTLNKS